MSPGGLAAGGFRQFSMLHEVLRITNYNEKGKPGDACRTYVDMSRVLCLQSDYRDGCGRTARGGETRG